MKDEVVSTREFIRNYKKMIAKKNIIIVANHGVPQGVFIPYKKWEEEKPLEEPKRKKFTIEDLEKYCVAGGDPHMSRDIDKILYVDPYKTNKKRK